MLTLLNKNDPYAEITVNIPPEEYEIFIRQTAVRMGKKEKIKGFRPGKAPYELLERAFGLEKIFAEAGPAIVNATISPAIQKEKINVIGQPEVTIEAGTYGQPFIYKIKAILYPTILLPDISGLSLEQKRAAVRDEEINLVLNQIAKMRSVETLVNRPATDQDMVVVNYAVSIAGVPQENGQIENFAIYLGEKHMVPDFEKNIVGLKAGEEKKFDVQFPADYFQKNFAGKKGQFTVKVKGVYQITIPAVDDELAKKTENCADLAELKNKIKNNLLERKTSALEKEMEKEIIDLIIEKTKFTTLAPEIIENELAIIIDELEEDLKEKQLSLSVWLGNLGKNLNQLKQDLRPQAEKRVKSALLIRSLAEREKITTTDEEIDQKIKTIEKKNTDNEKLDSAQARAYFGQVIRGEKTMSWLKEKIITK